MTTNRHRLNEGPPAFDPNIPPEELPTPDQVNWGRAFTALLGTKGTAENQLADALLRVPVLTAGIAVSGDEVTLEHPGAVISVTAVSAAVVGGKLPIPDGGAASGEVLIVYDGTYLPTLIFNGGDAVTEISVVQLRIPAAFVEMMQSLNPPPGS